MEYLTTAGNDNGSLGASENRYRLAGLSRKSFLPQNSHRFSAAADMAMTDDQRQDGSQDRGGGRGGMWDDLASSMHSIGEFIFEWKDQHCQSPCFVRCTTSSMDGSARMEPPIHGYRPSSSHDSSYTFSEGDISNHQVQMNPLPHTHFSTAPSGSPIIQFPSVHLGNENGSWSEEDDDSDVFL